MSSSVKVNVRVCGKKHVIEVKAFEEGAFLVSAQTECENVKQFVGLVNRLSVTDLTNKPSSKVREAVRRSRMSAICLVLAAIMNAAWTKEGLPSKNLARSAGIDSIELDLTDRWKTIKPCVVGTSRECSR
jgi:hypothetical protein